MTHLETIKSHKVAGGTLSVYRHDSHVCACPMEFAVFTPPQAADGPVPVLWYLSGLTCTWANANEKSGIHKYAAEHGLMVIFPDTSPRGADVANDDSYDLGQGAGFYVNATQEPWASHFQMESYVVEELPKVIAEHFRTADMEHQGITGHSMGGHGALTLHLKHPARFRSVSAFSPIVNPSTTPWGEKCFSAYLGENRNEWARHDACNLVRAHPSSATLLVDVGSHDEWEDPYLKSTRLVEACEEGGQKLEHRVREGYDHSYYFVSSFIGEHVAWHARQLRQ